MAFRTVQSVERAAALLRLLAIEQEPVALAQVADALGLAKSTAHGLLHTLSDVGFVQQEPGSGRYLLGSDLLHLGTAMLDLNELRSLTLNWVDTLAARTGEETRLAAFRDGRVVIAHHVFRTAPGAHVVETGSVVSLHATALGKVLLAFDPGAARVSAQSRLESFTFRTITERNLLVRELANVRDDGWSAAVEEVGRGIADVAAPVRDHDGYVIASVGVTGAADRLCDARLSPRADIVDQVVATARSVSRALGHGRVR
ncbi:IclR family transcriptional regulator [Tsukamurella soli]|uniref:IclR family transcriptional regulator n=1 Tax=Tsukamurella soli TaxID=644556 RepID=A0ABP8JML3_9ACTN